MADWADKEKQIGRDAGPKVAVFFNTARLEGKEKKIPWY